MDEIEVNTNYVCGTVHCHAGWYAIAVCDTSKNLDFFDGIQELAKDLGFENGLKLKLWGASNPKIWGNKNARDMFSNKVAFVSNTRPEGAKTLQNIVDHWEEVYNRLTE